MKLSGRGWDMLLADEITAGWAIPVTKVLSGLRRRLRFLRLRG
jgi:hypothetical protein